MRFFSFSLQAFRQGMSGDSTSRPAILFPEVEYVASVGDWAHRVQAHPDSLRCRIRKIVHCKSKSSSNHEFLLVHVREPSRTKAVLLVERIATFTDSDSSSILSDDDSSYDQHTHINPVLASISVSLPARDRVKTSHDGTTGSLTSQPFEKLHTLSFPKSSSSPSVAHFAALLTTVSQHILGYCSNEQSCSWFAYATLEVTKNMFGGVEKANKKCTQKHVPYGGIRIDERDSAKVLVREYRRAWEDFSRRALQMEKERLAAKAKPQTEKSKRKQEKKAKKKDDCDAFASMIRAMDS